MSKYTGRSHFQGVQIDDRRFPVYVPRDNEVDAGIQLYAMPGCNKDKPVTATLDQLMRRFGTKRVEIIE